MQKLELDQITFDISLIDFAPLYFHFLDGHLNSKFGSKIKIINNLIINYDFIDINEETDKIVFLKIKENSLSFSNFRNDNINFSFDEIIQNINDEIYINKIFGKLNYCLYNVGLDKHATTILFEIKDVTLIISFFNSGDGIQHNGTHSGSYYKPFKSFIIDTTNKLECFKKIITIILIPVYYKLITMIIYDKKKKVTINETNEKMVGNNYKIFKKLIELSKIIKDLKLNVDLNDIIKYEFKYNGILYNINNIYEYPNEEYFNNSFNNLSSTPKNNKLIKQKFFLYDNDSLTFETKDSYYKIILDYFKYKLFLSEKNDYNFKKFFENEMNFDFINKNILDKIIFKPISNDIYIKPQENGSCTWFSIYWPLLYFYITNNNPNKYYEMIKKIYKTFSVMLKNIFKQENFIKTKNLLLKKVLYGKFYNLKFLNEELSIENINSIYSDHSFKYEKMRIDNNYTVNKLYSFDNTFLNIFIEKAYDNIEVFTFIDLYNYYQYDKVFNEIQPNIPSTSFTDYNELLLNFQESYDIDNTFYINNFIFYSLYVNNIYNKYNFEDDNELINFCKYLYRYDIFIKICNKIYDISKELFKNIGTFQQETQKIYDYILPIMFNEKNRDFNFNNYYIKNTIGGITFKPEYIKKIFDKTSGCKYNINHFIDIDYNDNNKKYLKKYKRTIDYYKKLREYLYENPKYIYQDFNYNEYEIGEDYFILLNIHDIFKKEEFRNNLIKFYANIFFEKYKNNNTFTKELFWITFNLQLLITKYTSGLKRNEKYFNNFDSNINKFIIETSIISINDFYKKIIEIINNKDKNQFIEYLIKNKDIIIKTIEIILKKHFKTISFNYENNTINIDDKTFIYIKYIHVDATDLSLMINKDNILLLNINNTELLIIDNNNYIKLIIEPLKTDNINRKYIKVKIKIRYVDNSITTKFKINQIFYNNNPIINYKDLNEPFKYTIPMNCFNIIYKINGIYHIIYFCNNIINSLILGESPLSGQYTITINKNNLMYPDNKSYNTFYDLCINFDINHLNILYCNFKNDSTYMLLNDKYFDSFNFNKNQLLIEKLKNEDYLKINLIFPEIINIFDFKTEQFKLIPDKLRDSYLKKIIDTIEKVKKNTNDFFIFIGKNKNIKTIFENYSILYNYLISLKVLNTCNILIELLDIKYKKSNYIEFCSQLKIFYDYFNVKKYSFKYKFEAIFELISGNELLDEQMRRYNNIVNSFIDYINNKGGFDTKYDLIDKLYDDTIKINIIDQSGGVIYPLHHVMMGKGKSSILSPILSLYFSLISKKEPIIIVPEHLLLDTKEIINEYKHVFNIGNIQILSDDIAKGYFLENRFKSDNNSIMIIDEFDYLIDPLKSNFNITINKNKSIMEVFNMLVPPNILETIEEHKNYLIKIKDNKKISNLFYKNYLIDDIDNIIKDIKDGKLVENIKWGIHPKKFYAIPYKNKDTPLLTSNFSSFIITIYLTLYYYIIIHNYDITDIVVNCINEFKLFTEIFDREEPVIFTKEYIKELSLNENFKINILFKILFKNIFEGIKIAEYQYNTSFIDLINIDNLFKIGYSGTLNILPLNLTTIDKFDVISMEDPDEKQNIKFAIENKDTLIIEYKKNLDHLYEIINDNYDAIIDCIGLLKDYQNQEIAIKIFILFNKKRNIIFIDENDNKYVIIKDTENKIDLYNPNIFYEDPFIYFDQGHILGIDIKQDMYPIMKGLCIIGKNSIYSEVAQGMYRLRKLNMGHSINFLYYDEIGIINKKSLLKELKDRETKNNENKKINLEYQIIKSDLRKIRNKSEINKLYISEEFKNFKNEKYDIRYFEKVKYYTLEEINVDDINNIFKNIFYDDEFITLSEDIKKNILKLVYNLNSYNNDHTIEIEKLTLKEVEKSYEKVSNLTTFKKEDIIEFEFIDYSLINEIKIKHDNFIDYLPNIFTQVNGIDFIHNKSGYLFVYKNEKILVIPGYLIIYYDKYPIFNYKLNYINNKKIDDEIVKILKELDFFKVLYNQNKNEIESINYVLYKILSDKKNLFNYQIDLINKYKSIDKDILNIKQSLVQFQDVNISHVKNNVFSKKYIKINNIYFEKYIIYKKKYFKLKLITN
jgi:hypothetical protein